MKKLLEIQNLKTNFYTYEGVVKALDGINLDIKEGETLGVVGETGCGKSVTALSILRLILPPGKVEEGKVLFWGKRKLSVRDTGIDLLSKEEVFLREVRGNEISMIFQEPSSSLNPVYSIGDQISESFLLHQQKELCRAAIKEIEKNIKENSFFLKIFIYRLQKKIYKKMLDNFNSLGIRFLSILPLVNRYKIWLKKEATKRVVDILAKLGVPDPERVVERYPHELSGGMQQRVVIAIALACNPRLLIADEPTSNLDVTIQAQILDIIRRLKEKLGLSILFITHDLGVVTELCDRVAIMYAGNICEIAKVKELFKKPLHPYTKALMNSVPTWKRKDLESIKGNVPNLVNPPGGCRFHPRCDYALKICSREKPKIQEVENNHWVACHNFISG